MATYKVLQDIEAEDKLLGPLSLRQFIYALITFGILFMAWQLARVQVLLGVPLVVPAAFFGLLAAPLGAHQSSEIWLLAKIRFFIKPRRRIWDQTGLQELVTITVPKKLEHAFTNNLSQTEVKSRLQALANTIDSRGWAIKNVNVNMSPQPGYLQGQDSDRLIDVATLPQEVISNDITADDDILDAQNNPTAQHLDQMITASTKAHREELVQSMHAPSTSGTPPPDYWFMNQSAATNGPGQAVFGAQLVAPASDDDDTAAVGTPTTTDEQALLENIHHKQQNHTADYGHMRTLQPLGSKPAPTETAKSMKAQATTSGQTPDADILNLANNDDLNVATIARQANKNRDQGTDEVVISLR